MAKNETPLLIQPVEKMLIFAQRKRKKRMKKLIYILLLMVFVCACGNRSAKDKLVAIDSLVVHELYDSAYTLLSSIDTTLLNNMDTKAHYYLRRKHLGYLTSHSDSSNVLDSIVIPYYTSTDDKEKLAEAYYIKAYGEYNSGHKAEGVIAYKRAEEFANQTNNLRLKFKVAECLAAVNRLSGNYQLELDYAKKAQKLPSLINNPKWSYDALYSIITAYNQLNQKDSCLYFLSQLEPYLKYVPERELPSTLTMIAYFYKQTQPEKAKYYLEESLSKEETSYVLSHLADIYVKENKLEEAHRLWKRALTINDNNSKDNIIHNLLEYDLEHGRTDEVCKRVNEIIAIKDSIINSVRTDSIKTLQLNYDHEVEMNAAHERLIRWQRILGMVVFLAMWLIGYILWRKHKTKLQRLENEIQTKDYIRKVLDLELRAAKTEAQLSALQSENDENKQEIKRLEAVKQEVEEESKRLLGKEVQTIRRGIQLYEQLMNNEKVQTWSSADYEAITSFFEVSHSDAMKEIRQKYGRPTSRNMLYLILVNMGKTNEDISAIMSLNSSSLRTINYRLRKQRGDIQSDN